VHIHLGGPKEMVVSFASSILSDTKAKVWYGPLEVEDFPHVAEGETETYSQLMYWVEDLWEPPQGKPGLNRSEVAAIQDTSDWAYDASSGLHSASYKVVGPEEIEDGLGSYKNPAEHYDSPKIHTVVLTDLQPGKAYKYVVDNHAGIFTFTMPPEGPSFPFKIGMASDVGQTSASNATFNALKAMNPAVVLISGDLSYADGYYPRWDTWGRMSEHLLANVPLMSCPGNHETSTGEAFVSYKVRYPMPALASESYDTSYWSRDIGPVHVIALNSYAGFAPNTAQHTWLVKDLKKLDRNFTPWLIVLMHVPWYNSNNGHLLEGELMRLSMEKLLYEAGANLIVAGHVHSYERTFPMYNNETHPCGPTYLNNGMWEIVKVPIWNGCQAVTASPIPSGQRFAKALSAREILM